LINLNEISNANYLQGSNFEDLSQVNPNGNLPGKNQDSDDLLTFNELMQDYQTTTSTQQSDSTNGDNSDNKIKDKPTKDTKKINVLGNDLDNLSNIGMMGHLQYSIDSGKVDNKHKIDMDSLSENDVKSIKQILENPNIIINNMNQQNHQINVTIPSEEGQVSYKSLDCSKSLFKLLEQSYKAQKPIRLDFNNDSSVILKIDREGKLSAEFLAGSKAMESLLKDNLQNLKNKLDTEGIAYKNISYRDNSKKQNKKENTGD